MIEVVVDASVAVKWLLPPIEAEHDRDRAIAVLDGFRAGVVVLREPPHWLAEVAAVISRIAPKRAQQEILDLYAMRVPVVDTAELYATASELAIALDQHLFDTLYHAAALLTPGCTLVTADERYFNKARAKGAVVLLRDFTLPTEKRKS